MEKKMVGNACRTRNQIRNSKSSGSSFEYNALESLQVIYPDAYLTKQRGFQLKWDIQDDNAKVIWECKRLKSMSWNQAEKFLDKLSLLAPKLYKYYLLFKSNFQPCLVMYRETKQLMDTQFISIVNVMKFEDYFSTPFVKHTPIRKVEI